MTDVNADQHRQLVVHGLWELHVVEVPAYFAVDLTQDVGSLREDELGSISGCDDLRRTPELVHHFLEHGVVGFSVQDSDYHQRVVDLPISHDVRVELAGKFLSAVALTLNFDELRIFDSYFQPARSLLEDTEDLSGLVASSRVFLVDDDPVPASKVHCVADRSLTHRPLITINDLPRDKHFRSSQDVCLHRCALRLNCEAPVLE